MTGHPTITIVVGVLNGASLIEKMIDSFCAQTLEAKELVIWDGGSTDGTVDILKRRSADIAWWSSGKDRGLYDAWNKALDHCRGDYVGFLGCDDQFADNGVLQRLADRAVIAKPDLICSLNVLVDANGKFLRTIGAPYNFASMKRSMNLAHACLLHRRALLDEVGRFNPQYRIGADYDLLLRLGPETKAEFVEQISVRVGGDGMSHRRWRSTYYEHWHLQANSPHVGTSVATKNLVGNVARYAYRKIRGRR